MEERRRGREERRRRGGEDERRRGGEEERRRGEEKERMRGGALFLVMQVLEIPAGGRGLPLVYTKQV